MKKIITILFAGLLTVSLSAQTDQGTFAIGLNTGIGFSSTTIKDIENFHIGGVPVEYDDAYDKINDSKFEMNLMNFGDILNNVNLGYFVADNFAIFLGLVYESDKHTEEYAASGLDPDITTTTQFTLSPAVRYYMEMGSGYMFGHVRYGMSNGKTEWKSGGSTSETETKGSQFSIGVGYSLLVHDNIAIEPILYYNMLKDTQVDGGITSSFNVDDLIQKQNTFGLTIGLTMLLY